jgi:predicted NBD/HSP70 family sugar kinase
MRLAVDLGGTQVRAAKVADDGAVLTREARPTPVTDPTPDALLAWIAAQAEGCASVVFGVPGRVDHGRDRLDVAPNLPPQWGFDAADLSATLGRPCALANDADLAAVGEAYAGAGQGASDLAFVTLSTGVGAGVLLGGRLVRGRWSSGELGHVVIDRTAWRAGAPATVEALASGTALARRAGRPGPAVVEAALAGDPAARDALAEVVEAAALGLRALIYLFSLERVIVGGGLGRTPTVLADLSTALTPHLPPGLPTALVPGQLGDDAALVGAAFWHRAQPDAPASRPR